MESSLRKTIIKLQQGIELHFWKISKLNRFGCKAFFFNPNTNSLYDITVLSKSLLQLNSISEIIWQNLKTYQNINNKIVCPIYSVTEDGDLLYIISQGQKYKLSDLVQKRQGLSQFQIIYFTLDLIQLINYLKSRGLFYQIIDIDQVYITKDMKLLIPYSIWISDVNKIKQMALRHQDKKQFIAPEFLNNSSSLNPDEINTWNIGVFIFQLIEATKPFTRNHNQLSFGKDVSPQTVQLIQKLLKKNPNQRLKFPLILLQSLFKKYRSLPHLLPSTIFSCPPSNQYISEYCRKFEQNEKQKLSQVNKILNIQTAQFIQDNNTSNIQGSPSKNFKSSRYIKPSDRSITQSKCFVTEFVDISHVFGYGYQMNTGLICFVFNDGSQMYFQSAAKKTVTYTTDKKIVNRYIYEKITQQSQMKKKLFILQAYTKSIKKFKHNPNPLSKAVTVSQYYKTNSAAIFLLTNQAIQIIFNDKMIFMLTKHSIQVQNKNSQKFELYQHMQQSAELLVRKKYAITMAQKLFRWDPIELQRIKCKGEHKQVNNVIASQIEPQKKNKAYAKQTF